MTASWKWSTQDGTTYPVGAGIYQPTASAYPPAAPGSDADSQSVQAVARVGQLEGTPTVIGVLIARDATNAGGTGRA